LLEIKMLFVTLLSCLSFLYNYFDGSTKLFPDLHLAKFLDTYFSKIVLSLYQSIIAVGLLTVRTKVSINLNEVHFRLCETDKNRAFLLSHVTTLGSSLPRYSHYYVVVF